MVDIHNHSIFGVDDGAKDFEISKKMLIHAAQDGIEAVIATPHYQYKGVPEDLSALQNNYETIVKWIEEIKLPLKLYLGNEAFLVEELTQEIIDGKCMTLAGSRYVLVEFYSNAPSLTVKRIFFQMCMKNIVPIIAHCERIVEDKKDLAHLEEYIGMGCLLQVNARTVLNPSSHFQKKWLYKYLKSGKISFVASDAHNLLARAPELKKAYIRTIKLAGVELTKEIFENNPMKILSNERIGN